MKSLILDIDGVLVRDKALLNHVKHNCVQYVRHKMPEVKAPAQMNEILYSNYGHTAKGLRKAYKINTDDFNKFVYDKPLHDHLWSVLSGTEFQKDAEQIHSLIKDGWTVRLKIGAFPARITPSSLKKGYATLNGGRIVPARNARGVLPRAADHDPRARGHGGRVRSRPPGRAKPRT